MIFHLRTVDRRGQWQIIRIQFGSMNPPDKPKIKPEPCMAHLLGPILETGKRIFEGFSGINIYALTYKKFNLSFVLCRLSSSHDPRHTQVSFKSPKSHLVTMVTRHIKHNCSLSQWVFPHFHWTPSQKRRSLYLVLSPPQQNVKMVPRN